MTDLHAKALELSISNANAIGIRWNPQMAEEMLRFLQGEASEKPNYEIVPEQVNEQGK